MSTIRLPSQPDEGYSEDPLNPASSSALSVSTTSPSASGAALTIPADLPAWLAKNLPYLPVSVKSQLAVALLDDLPTAVVAQIAERMHPRLYIDFIQYLPPEVCLKILGYLDPASLLSVARSCRSWHDLAMDRQLWERLYLMEGWRAMYPEIQAWEDKMNRASAGVNSSVSSHHRVMASEDGHTCKKRAISEDDDLEMPDVDRHLRGDESTMTGASIFGGPVTPANTAGAPRGSKSISPEHTEKMDVDGSASSSRSRASERTVTTSADKAKGKAAEPKLQETQPNASSVARPSLWVWDIHSARYRLNWKHLYALRRRLESNWEQGRYTNFQLPRPDHPEEGHQECIYTIQFDSQYLVSGSRDRTIRIWSMNNRRLIRPPLRGHEGSVLCLQFDADPEEDLIVSGSSDSNVILWRFSTGEVIQRLTKAHTESVLNVKFDKRILVTCSKDKSIKIFNRRPLKYGDDGYNNADVDFVNPVPIRIRDYGYGDPTSDMPLIPAYTMIGKLEGHGAAVNAVQIHENEVVSASGDRNIKVWDWTKQVCCRTVVGHGKGIACVQYDGRRIVSGSSDNEVKVFDRLTGLEVASLRAHTNLVRTVQAGFGDLPYSVQEDKAEAKKIDHEYFKAVESGTISPELRNRSNRSRGNGNAGSSRPQDITAFGASLPPGGGGGRFARIVSGSYDQKIIIWRRDKDGVWEPAHRLRQEEAAEAAQSWAVATGSIPNQTPSLAAGLTQVASNVSVQGSTAGAPASSAASPLPLHQPHRPMAASMPPAPGASHGGAGGIFQPGAPRAATESSALAALTPDSPASFMTLIDLIVPRGVLPLQQALASYPGMLAHHGYIQAAISREPSPVSRSQLRQVLANAMIHAQHVQSRMRLASLQHAAATTGQVLPGHNITAPFSSLAGQSSSSSPSPQMMPVPNINGLSGSFGPRQNSNGLIGLHGHDATRSSNDSQSGSLNQTTQPPVAVGTSGSASAQDASQSSASAFSGRPSVPQVQGHFHIQGHGQPGMSGMNGMNSPSPQPQLPPAPIQSHSTPVPPAQGQGHTPPGQTPYQTPPPAAHQQATPEQQVANGPQAQDGQAAAQQAQVANADNSPARVFKLQFDARRIICCSQTSVIVGWDFCNSDPELEHVSRLFGTIV